MANEIAGIKKGGRPGERASYYLYFSTKLKKINGGEENEDKTLRTV